jgi:sigma-B regulation protein RsbU (phosphoserine phosphatase)
MAAIGDQFLRAQLEERRKRLQAAGTDPSSATSLARLLRQVDSALERMNSGTYGICEECHEPIEASRLFADPLASLCLDHLTAEQQRALENDLELAARVQRSLLPPNGMRVAGWHFHYHWRPMALVSGDYCDLIHSKNGPEEVWFLVGDVSGKGVAASMLMTHLHAIFRSLTSMNAPLDELTPHDGPPDNPRTGKERLSFEQVVRLANSVFSKNVLAGLFATLVAGRATSFGEVEVFNAGHCPVLIVRRDGITELPSTGLPLGMFSEGPAFVQKVKLERGESFFLYTDGLSEALNPAGAQYGEERLAGFLAENRSLAPDALVRACLRDLEEFASGIPLTDDLTLMVVQQAAHGA